MADSAPRRRFEAARVAGLSADLRGALAMAGAMAALTVNFGLVKLATQTMPVGQAMFLRGVAAGCLVAIIALRSGAVRRARLALHRAVTLRTLSEAAAATVYFLALTAMPLGDATIIVQAQPLTVTAAAALVFGEVVRPKRWLAILAGFGGVLVVLRPVAEGVNAGALLMVLVVALNVIRDLATKAMPAAAPTSIVVAFTLTAQASLGAASSALQPWVAPSGFALLILAATSLLLVAGLYLLIHATRTGALSVVAPLRYSSVLWAVAFGYVVWGDVIDAAMLLGAAIIVLSGLYLSYPDKGRRAVATAAR